MVLLKGFFSSLCVGFPLDCLSGVFLLMWSLKLCPVSYTDKGQLGCPSSAIVTAGELAASKGHGAVQDQPFTRETCR